MLAQRRLQLAVFDEAVASIIERVERTIDVLLGRIIPECRNCLAEFLLINRAVAILVPLAEQIDQLDRVLGEDLVQLVDDAHAARRVQLHHRRQRGNGRTLVVLIEILRRQLRAAAMIGLVRCALQVGRHLRAIALAEHCVELLVLEVPRLVLVEHVEDGTRIGL